MKLTHFICLLALACGFSACVQNADFTISGEIKNPGDVKKIYLLEAGTTRVTISDSASLDEQGKFQFKHFTPYANLYKLRIGGFFFDLIAANGDKIEFSTDLKDEKHQYDVKGSENSEKIQAFNQISNHYGEINTKLDEQYQAEVEAAGKESEALSKKYFGMYNKNISDYSNALIDFKNKNETSLASFYAMVSLDSMRYEKELIAYSEQLKEKKYFTDNPGVQAFIGRMAAAKPLSIGQKAPEFIINGLDNKPVKLSDYKGKYVMLDFWASWCVPCRQENPNVVKQYNLYKDKGFDILGISLDEDRDLWKKAIDADKLTWKHASELKSFEGSTPTLYRVYAIPSNFIIDPQGIIVAKNITGSDLEEFLKRTFSKAQ
ncbi:TlpA disulfide reductase family protein [Mucilaginibacter auburnensis]|uniref:Peroxiredoxin n=1 Tax=Mucilaginibacter auburnensis TaxID=1457233 RepID=A0A2H9VMP6_9SPHI|nr:TlpA disulfide reductase family protein [Mucilaginibacter auburnensis]PJJ79583.1 peroxiredoxin [Mucilaginibacter auburnensis]